MVPQIACLDQSSQDMEHSSGQEMMRIELAEVPASRQNVRPANGAIRLSLLDAWLAFAHCITRVMDANKWGVAYIPARV